MIKRCMTLTLSALAFGLSGLLAADAHAQGITTGSMSGFVTDSAGNGVLGAQIEITNRTTGFTVRTTSREGGRYNAQGLETGGPYTVIARRIGFEPATRSPLFIRLSETTKQDLVLSQQSAVLQTVQITGSADPAINPSRTGTGATLSDSALRRLPSLNRNFADFVKSVPQVSTTTGFLSGGGVNLRQNLIQIDGAVSSDPFGLGTTGQPGGQANAKSIPLDAVKEYQVLLSPFDVRQGNFGGLLINAVTKGGTNQFHGSLYGYTRDQKLTRKQEYLTDFTQQNYGGTFGGPIIKDRIFFFGSGEIQRNRSPTTGSYIGASDQFVSQATIDQVASIMTKYGLSDVGSGAQIQLQNPNRNLFLRLDAVLPKSTRLVLRNNYAAADRTNFSRSLGTVATPQFTLTSNKYEFSSKTKSTVAEFLTNLSSGIYNELLFNYSTIKDFRTVPVQFPQVTINGVPRSDAGTGTARIVLGTESSSQGNSLDQRVLELTDNFTVPLGSHALTFGTKNQFYKSINLFANNSIGNWTFATIDALNNGIPTSYTISAPAPTDPNGGLATLKANQYAVYAEDMWTVSPTFTIRAGLRYDKPDFRTLPPENDSVFSQYGRHTSKLPENGQFSPRFGFNWDVTGDAVNQLRGGIGSFSGAVPFVYLSNAFGSSGLSGYSSLTCNNNSVTNTSVNSQKIPAFNAANIANPPLQCLDNTRPNGTVAAGAAIAGPAAGAAVATIDPKFKLPKYLKSTLAFDHRFSNGFVGTLEGLYSRSQNNAFYQNLALAGPQGTDQFGRTLYGTFTAAKTTAPTSPATAVPKTIGQRQQVLDVTNSSGDYTWSVTGQMRKSFTDNFEASGSYTYQQSRDVVSLTSSTQGSNFRYQRSVSGDLLDRSVTKSKYDQPHRIIMSGSYRFPWLTDISMIYSGNSGAPFDYVYGSNGGSTGDLNADGQTQNDLMYVPTDATDPNQILFTGYNGTATAQANAATQAAAFDKFISTSDCLQKARGTIMKRNACRNPWINVIDLSIAQSLRPIRFQNVQLRLDVINFSNLLNKNWGEQAFSDQGSTCGQICSSTTLLLHTDNRLATGTTPRLGVYTFDTTFKPFSARNASSNYRMQLSLRYSF